MKSYLEISDVGISFETEQGSFEALSRVNLRIEKGSSSPSSVTRAAARAQSSTWWPGCWSRPLGASFSMVARWRAGARAAMVFQNHALPWLSVQQNVALAVAQVESDKRAVAERVDYYLLVQMDHASQKMPHELSGDEAAGRHSPRPLALPKVLLMDEPFGALDALTRAHLQDALMAIQAELGNTVIMITHDVDEAVLLSDRIVVMMTNGPSATVGRS